MTYELLIRVTVVRARPLVQESWYEDQLLVEMMVLVEFPQVVSLVLLVSGAVEQASLGPQA